MLHRSNIKKRKRYSASRISSLSTFTLGKSNTLHGKSTYFYRWSSYLVPGMCGLAFLVGLGLAINPTINKVEQVSAHSISTASETDGTPAISLKITGAANGESTTVTAGQTTYRHNTLEVTGHDVGRYDLTINTGVGSTGELVGRSNPFATIGKVTDQTQGGDISENTWGYAIEEIDNFSSPIGDDKLYYYSVPSGTGDSRSASLKSRNGIRKEDGNFTDTYKLVFAANISSEMPSDHYEADVYISVIGSAALTTATGITTDSGETIYYMQDIEEKYCNAIEQDATNITLTDRRDGKNYFISKLQDGNCWMTQNLDYDIEKTLYPATSDVTTETTMTTIAVTSPSLWTSSSAEANYYYDPDQNLKNGEHYYYTYSGHSSSRVCNTANGLSDCAKIPDTDNDQFTPQILKNNVEENHYLVGNYYSWYAATAGSGKSTLKSGRAENSICPAGWQLPTGNSTTALASFDGLLTLYGLQEEVVSNTYTIYDAPLYFVYGGTILAINSTLSSAGGYGYYRSSTPDSNGTNAYHLRIYNKVFPSNVNAARSDGMSVRCVAK